MWRILRLWPAFQASRPGPEERPVWPGGLWGGGLLGPMEGWGGGTVPATPAILLHLQHRNGGGGGACEEKIYEKITFKFDFFL